MIESYEINFDKENRKSLIRKEQILNLMKQVQCFTTHTKRVLPGDIVMFEDVIEGDTVWGVGIVDFGCILQGDYHCDIFVLDGTPYFKNGHECYFRGLEIYPEINSLLDGIIGYVEDFKNRSENPNPRSKYIVYEPERYIIHYNEELIDKIVEIKELQEGDII